MLEVLLEHDSKLGTGLVNKSDNIHGTPLHYAARHDDIKMVEVLLKHGAKPDTVNHSGHSPLDYAIRKGHKQVAEALLAKGNPSNEDKTLLRQKLLAPSIIRALRKALTMTLKGILAVITAPVWIPVIIVEGIVGIIFATVSYMAGRSR